MAKIHFAFSTLHLTLAVATLSAATASAAALPDAYTAVEYIQSDGTQYIDTGVVPKTTTRVVCDFRLTAMPSDRVRCGWASAGSKEAFWFGTDNDHANFSASVCGNSVQANTGVPVDTTRHTFDISMSAVKFDDATVANPGAAFTDAASGNTMYLFASRQGWNPNIGAYGSMEIYSCQIYDGTTLTRDFVPAVRLSDGAAGLYETGNGVFYENQGLGDFSAGPAKSADYYVAVEYIESDGDQYIDTLFTLGSNHVSTIEVQPTELPTINGTGT
ncbi:MAG: hypothetical protein IJT64_00735, partial [Kiritimatiellae bacterium]|nr:hypothetical protein [Kiritimatiellia bacterium]